MTGDTGERAPLENPVLAAIEAGRRRREGSYVDAYEVARATAEANNNPDMKGWLRLYLESVERAGFRFVRAAENGGDQK